LSYRFKEDQGTTWFNTAWEIERIIVEKTQNKLTNIPIQKMDLAQEKVFTEAVEAVLGRPYCDTICVKECRKSHRKNCQCKCRQTIK